MTKAIHIDAQSRTITVIDVHDLGDMQKAVGGPIELAPPCGADVNLYVNEEGSINGTRIGFSFGRTPVIFGNGLILGPADKEGYDTDITLTVDQVVRSTVWYGTPAEGTRDAGAEFTRATGYTGHEIRPQTEKE